MNILDKHSLTYRQLRRTLKNSVEKALKKFAPPEKISTKDWANKFRWLSTKQSARPGKFSTAVTPWVDGILDACDDRSVHKVVCQKSAQVAWTDGVLINVIAKRIHIDPCGIVLLFPKEGSITKFLNQKFVPSVESTPELSDLIDVTTSRKSGNTKDFKNFPGGFIALVGSNAPDNVKSLSAPLVAIEEPDDCNTNVGQQGDSKKLLEERSKTYSNRLILSGGTPSVKSLSPIETDYENSDQRKFFVPCHECGESHVLSWDNVLIPEDKNQNDKIYGIYKPDEAMYVCPCGTAWDDQQKNRNVKKGKWIATAPFHGVAGFYINELYSSFKASSFAELARKYIEAKNELEKGDESAMIVFTNSTLGLGYEYKTDAPEVDELEDKALDYNEMLVPQHGLVVTAGVDVQHDRFAIVLRAWGRDEESWLVYWNEIYGVVTDKTDPVWGQLDNILFSPIKHTSGVFLRVSAISIDSSDGQTNDLVYAWVRERINRGVMAIKGANSLEAEIYAKPRAIDFNAKKKTKAQRYGLQVYAVGTNKAKDLIDGRLKLTGIGPSRFHFYKDVRSDYFNQLLSEIKAPSRAYRKKMIWQKKAGERNEALDCEVYALHAARHIKVHLMRPDAWDALEKKVLQQDLFVSEVVSDLQTVRKQSAKAKSRTRTISKGVEI